jgi:hypothetical protein
MTFWTGFTTFACAIALLNVLTFVFVWIIVGSCSSVTIYFYNKLPSWERARSDFIEVVSCER